MIDSFFTSREEKPGGRMGFRISYFLFALLAASVECRDFVPVLIWGTQTPYDPSSTVSGLNKLDTEDFFNFLVKKVNEAKPNIVLFEEENLSMEDFSWRDVNEQGAYPLLQNLTKSADSTIFFPSVRNPYRALRKLINHGYSWQKYGDGISSFSEDDEPTVLLVKLSEPDSFEGRPELLRSHDKEISELYSNVLTLTSNIMAIYTGNHSSWIDADVKYARVKRSDPDDKDMSEEPVGEGTLWMDNNRTIYIYTQKATQFQEGSEFVNLSDTTNNPTIEKMKGAIALDLNFKYKNEKLQVDFFFNGSESSDWTLDHVIVNEKKDQMLFPSMQIEAPQGYSFYCQKSVLFSDRENQVTLSLSDFQVQPYVRDGKFGPAIDCVPYFSIAIWSGLFIVFILTMVLAWGIVMIMDINTMDRFDDAKGKTITISATD